MATTTRLSMNVLAQAATFINVSVEDLVPSPRRVCRISKTQYTRARAARRAINALVDAGLLVEVYGDKFEPTSKGLATLTERGYVKHHNGSWLREGGRRPSWAW